MMGIEGGEERKCHEFCALLLFLTARPIAAPDWNVIVGGCAQVDGFSPHLKKRRRSEPANATLWTVFGGNSQAWQSPGHKVVPASLDGDPDWPQGVSTARDIFQGILMSPSAATLGEAKGEVHGLLFVVRF